MADQDFAPEMLKYAGEYIECRSRRSTPQPEWTEAWEQFYQTYDPLIRRFAIASGVRPGELDDFLQDIWKELISKLRTFVDDPRRGHFRTWLFCVVRSRAIDAARSKSHRATERLSPFQEAQLVSPDPGPVNACDRQTVHEKVQRLLIELRKSVSECTYRVFHMWWIEGRTVPGIASALHLTARQVYFRHDRAKRKFAHLSNANRADGLLDESARDWLPLPKKT